MKKKELPISNLISSLLNDFSEDELKEIYLSSLVSSKISSERMRRKMNQKEFADFMGVSQGMVSKWENGDFNFTLSKISKIFTKLGIDFTIAFKDDVGYAYANYKVKSPIIQRQPNYTLEPYAKGVVA